MEEQESELWILMNTYPIVVKYDLPALLGKLGNGKGLFQVRQLVGFQIILQFLDKVASNLIY